MIITPQKPYFNLIFYILLSSPAYSSRKKMLPCPFPNIANETKGRTSANVKGAHILPFLFPPALSWKEQHSERGSHWIIKLLPKLTESFATSLGPSTEVYHIAPGRTSSPLPNWPLPQYKAIREAGKTGFSQHWRQRFISCLYPIILYDAASTVLEMCHYLLNNVERTILYFWGEENNNILHHH